MVRARHVRRPPRTVRTLRRDLVRRSLNRFRQRPTVILIDDLEEFEATAARRPSEIRAYRGAGLRRSFQLIYSLLMLTDTSSATIAKAFDLSCSQRLGLHAI